jgi:DNA-binding PadR family transcriptional regulator
MPSETVAEAESATDCNIDILNLQILGILTDQTLYKKQVADRIEDWAETTVGKRIDALQSHGLVRSMIVKGSEDDNRDLFIAFTTTESGDAVLDDYLVCETSDCDAFAACDEHTHRYVAATVYF